MSQIEALETELGLSLPNEFVHWDEVTQDLVIKYLKQLTTIEKKAYTIGKEHLGTSFHVLKSNGFVTWKRSLMESSATASSASSTSAFATIV